MPVQQQNDRIGPGFLYRGGHADKIRVFRGLWNPNSYRFHNAIASGRINAPLLAARKYSRQPICSSVKAGLRFCVYRYLSRFRQCDVKQAMVMRQNVPSARVTSNLLDGTPAGHGIEKMLK